MSSTDTLWAGNRTASARLPSGVNITCATLSGKEMVSVILTSVPLTESTLTELSPRLATSAILPDGLKFNPEGCLPPVMVAASFGGFAFISITKILLSGTCLSALPSLTTSTEFATRATEPDGSISRLTGGPTTEFSSGRVATILGSSGLARSTIRTESLPGGERTFLPSSSHRSFSSRPTIMNGLAWAQLRLALQSRAVASANPAVRNSGIVAFSRMGPASDGPVRGGDYARSPFLASAAYLTFLHHLRQILSRNVKWKSGTRIISLLVPMAWRGGLTAREHPAIALTT